MTLEEITAFDAINKAELAAWKAEKGHPEWEYDGGYSGIDMKKYRRLTTSQDLVFTS
jgi:hypothetical protein